MADTRTTLRLFFALQAPDEQNAALVERVAPLVAALGAQRVPAENLHATLCFIGNVAAEDLERVRRAAAGQRGQAAALRFDTLEIWRKPRVLCATAGESLGTATLRSLAEGLARAMLDAGFAPDIKPFRPHLTLARKVVLAHADGHFPQVLAPAVVLRCERYVLMESRKGKTGSIYSVIDSWPLDDDESG